MAGSPCSGGKFRQASNLSEECTHFFLVKDGPMGFDRHGISILYACVFSRVPQNDGFPFGITVNPREKGYPQKRTRFTDPRVVFSSQIEQCSLPSRGPRNPMSGAPLVPLLSSSSLARVARSQGTHPNNTLAVGTSYGCCVKNKRGNSRQFAAMRMRCGVSLPG